MNESPFAAVICAEHGRVDIDQAEYERQLAMPHAMWRCPACGNVASFDEDRFDALHPRDESATF